MGGIFYQSVHTLFHSDVYVPVYLFGCEVIFVDGFLGYDIDGYFVEPLIVHLIVEEEFLDVHYKSFSVWIWQDTGQGSDQDVPFVIILWYIAKTILTL